MNQKTKTISIRLSKNDYDLLTKQAEENHMSYSTYLRSLIHGVDPTKSNYAPEIASALSRLYVRLEQLGIGSDPIAKEVKELCQMLSL